MNWEVVDMSVVCYIQQYFMKLVITVLTNQVMNCSTLKVTDCTVDCAEIQMLVQ